MDDNIVIPKSGYIIIDSKLINGDIILNEILNINRLRTNNRDIGALLNQDEILLLKNIITSLKTGGSGVSSLLIFSDSQLKLIFKLLDKFYCHDVHLVLQLVKTMLTHERLSKIIENYIEHVFEPKFNLFQLLEKIINSQISLIRNNKGGVNQVYGNFISNDSIQILINMFKFYKLQSSSFHHLLIKTLISRPIFLNSIIKTYEFHLQCGNINFSYSKSITILFLNISIYFKENRIIDHKFISNFFQCLDIFLKLEKNSNLLYVIVYSLNLILKGGYKSRNEETLESIKNSLTTREIFLKSSDKELIDQIEIFFNFYNKQQLEEQQKQQQQLEEQQKNNVEQKSISI